jgi:hypothetical protein
MGKPKVNKANWVKVREHFLHHLLIKPVVENRTDVLAKVIEITKSDDPKLINVLFPMFLDSIQHDEPLCRYVALCAVSRLFQSKKAMSFLQGNFPNVLYYVS